ncbi:hypothetical protein OAL46_02365, partial [Akkermansiaceae bacterium]|nr:hypothetical protein [Akkermansiaceae bacterium]
GGVKMAMKYAIGGPTIMVVVLSFIPRLMKMIGGGNLIRHRKKIGKLFVMFCGGSISESAVHGI